MVRPGNPERSELSIPGYSVRSRKANSQQPRCATASGVAVKGLRLEVRVQVITRWYVAPDLIRLAPTPRRTPYPCAQATACHAGRRETTPSSPPKLTQGTERSNHPRPSPLERPPGGHRKPVKQQVRGSLARRPARLPPYRGPTLAHIRYAVLGRALVRPVVRSGIPGGEHRITSDQRACAPRRRSAAWIFSKVFHKPLPS